MQAGKLRHRLAFDEPVETRSASGDPVVAWEERFTTWAAIEPVRGREFYNRDQIRDDIDTRIRIRAGRHTAPVTPKWRARHGATIYNLRSLAHVELRQREVEIMASSGLNDG